MPNNKSNRKKPTTNQRKSTYRISSVTFLLLLLVGLLFGCLFRTGSSWVFVLVPARKSSYGRRQRQTFATSTNVFPRKDELPQQGLFSAATTVIDRVVNMYQNAPDPNTPYDNMITTVFPGALSNKDLELRVVTTLLEKGYTERNTLLVTSLCCDELARRLEDDFVELYGNNFNLGGLSGFPFAGNTGFENMALHIPDEGSCLIVYGPHVGISTTGVVGVVERSGIEECATCCASAIAASHSLLQAGSSAAADPSLAFTDLQQGAVQQLLSVHTERLQQSQAPMLELPYALYSSLDSMLQEIVQAGCGNVRNNIALLGGIQINTAPQALDYFLPLRFEYRNNQGELLENMIGRIV